MSFCLVPSLYPSVVFVSSLHIDLHFLLSLLLVVLSFCALVNRIISSAEFITPLYMGTLCVYIYTRIINLYMGICFISNYLLYFPTV